MKIELLAPAGGLKQYIAAVNNGADAVYIGGPYFNARMNATNFTLDEMKEAIDFGHLRNVKTYVTMNTLIFNSELKDALKYAYELYNMGVDALIIQDLGLGKLIHENLPDFELHLSTQGTVYNKEGVLAAKELGYKRVVLSRECSLDEIKSCISKDLPEIEVFIHGALCICYSGQCQMSRVLGGRSGNRGECAQPCRLPYYVNGKESFILSPKDLCALPVIDKLISMGVTSLKIEGRMKSPEYTATVVRIYRKYIDMYLSTHKLNIDPKDMEDLNQIFNRGGFSTGYLENNPKDQLMSTLTSKNQGINIGHAISNNGIYLEAMLNRQIAMGDVIECVKSHESFKVTYLKNQGNIYILGDLKGDILPGEEINRIVSKELNDKAVSTFTNEKTFKKTPIDLSCYLYVGHHIKINARALGKTVTLESEYLVEEGRNSIVKEEEIKDKLSKMGNTPFKLEKISIKSDPNIFIPISKLNEIRRQTIDLLISNVLSSTRNNAEYKDLDIKDFKITIPDYKFESKDLAILPQVTKGSYDEFLRTHLNGFKEKGAKVLVHNISSIKPLSLAGITVYGGYGLNITNSKTIEAYKELGMSDMYMGSLELAIEEDFKYVPLMVTEHEVPFKEMSDRKGKKYLLEYNSDTNKTYIFKE